MQQKDMRRKMRKKIINLSYSTLYVVSVIQKVPNETGDLLTPFLASFFRYFLVVGSNS